MKQIIILVAFIALGMFISGIVQDFKAPVENNVNAAVTQMNSNVPKTK